MGAPREAEQPGAVADGTRRFLTLLIAVSAIAGAAAVAAQTFISSAAAQELTSAQCRVIGGVYESLADGMDMSEISQSAAELAKLGKWIDGGCRGTVTLRRYPDVAAYTHAMETVLRSPRLRNHGASISSHVIFG